MLFEVPLFLTGHIIHEFDMTHCIMLVLKTDEGLQYCLLNNGSQLSMLLLVVFTSLQVGDTPKYAIMTCNR